MNNVRDRGYRYINAILYSLVGLLLFTHKNIDSHAKSVWFVLKIKFNQNLYGFFTYLPIRVWWILY